MLRMNGSEPWNKNNKLEIEQSITVLLYVCYRKWRSRQEFNFASMI